MSRLLLVLKVLLSLGLIAWVLSRSDLEALGDAVATADPLLLVAAAAAHLLSFGLLCLRWWLLLVRVVPGIAFRDTLAAFWLGLFGNNLLPSGMGGDALKVVQLRSEAVSGRSLLASVLMDRAIGLMGVLLIGLAALLAVAGDVLPAWSQTLITALLVAIPLGLAVFFSAPIQDLLAWLERRCQRWRPLVLGIHTLQRLQIYRQALGLLLVALMLTVALQSLVVCAYALIGASVGAELGVGVYFVAIPILFIAINLPISVGGLGVREGVFVALMTRFGMDQGQAVAISVLYLGVLLALTLPGGLVLLGRRGATLQASDPDD